MTGVEAIPGTLIGLGLMWWLGVRQMPPTPRASLRRLARRDTTFDGGPVARRRV